MKLRFSYVMLLMALIVAGCAGYFSVLGLGQLFAGSSTMIIIMATILEVGKIVTTTALHKYWNDLAKTIRTYLSISVVILMLITSAGIYGFLSNAYQKTANKLEIQEIGTEVLNAKKMTFETNVLDNNKIKESKAKRIDQLNSLRLNQENRLDSAKTQKSKNLVRTDIQTATEEIQILTKDIDKINIENKILSDSISAYNVKMFEIKSNSSVANEVGPLKYISELTNTPMSKVVNCLILLLIFVFDPLAVALVISTNKIFELEKNRTLSPVTPTYPSIEPIDNSVSVPYVHSEVITKEQPDTVITTTNTDGDPLLLKAKQQPVKKIELNDIKEIKENRGFTVPIPKSNNTIQRIGSNKIIKNNNDNNLYFNREHDKL